MCYLLPEIAWQDIGQSLAQVGWSDLILVTFLMIWNCARSTSTIKKCDVSISDMCFPYLFAFIRAYLMCCFKCILYCMIITSSERKMNQHGTSNNSVIKL